MFDSFLVWLDGTSIWSVAIAATVFVAVLGYERWFTEPGKLDGRLRGMVDKIDSSKRHPLSLKDPFQWIASRSGIRVLRKRIVEWLSDHSSVSKKKQLRLKQAGFRTVRVYLYFEMASLGLIAFMGLGSYLAVRSSGLLSQNPALGMAIIALAAILGGYAPQFYLKHRIKTRRQEFEANWDDAIGLLIICLDAGLSIEIALRRIALELAPTAPVLAEELIITVTDLALRKERRIAYLNLAERIDLASVQSVTVALIQSEKQGASIASSLRTISQSNRQNRIARAEEKAAALGPKMTVPMIVFFLPVIFVIILAPIFLTSNF